MPEQEFTMNIFKQAEQVKAKADSTKRGNQVALKSTITVPCFKGLYRKGEPYTIKVKQGKKKIDVSVKPLTGAFILSYFTCLAACIVQDENAYRAASNSTGLNDKELEPVQLTSHLVEVVLSSEGFSLDDYKQGKTTGARRIESHLKAMREQRDINIAIKDSVITGLNQDIVQAVLSAI